ncbi:MAG: 2-C-methyl-D-erythritol 2,4-cyclodiphosphate synthase [Planctomycetota bacterium]|nr:2-C-methyl-D-erythritol 2,4-cyclodiphosphate synthase [Planctomycetota bacterium]
MRVGVGHHSHPFDPNRVLVVGGVKITGAWGLRGPGDADVLLRSVADALLGAAALGDLEDHFPPHDEVWRDAPSAALVSECGLKLAARGLRVQHLDAVLHAARPDLRPHRAAMAARIGSLLGLPEGMVNVKVAGALADDAIAAQVIATVAAAPTESA